MQATVARLFSEFNTALPTHFNILNKLADGNRKTSAKEFVMNLYSLSMNADDLAKARQHLATLLPDVKRSHLAEALAAAQGFNTSIAIQTAIRSNPRDEKRYGRFDADAFLHRLTLLGYDIAKDVQDTLMDARFPKSISLNFVLTASGAVHSTTSELGQRLNELDAPSRDMVDVCKRVLSEVKEFRKTPGETSSYGFKHRIEETFCLYISNGAFIQAAVELGMEVKTGESPNAQLYVGNKAFEEALAVAWEKTKKAKFAEMAPAGWSVA